jgi:hypothetical protein
MHFIGYDFSLTREGIKLDEELNLDRLGWKGGDIFRLENINGRVMLRKIDPVEKFLIDGEQNGRHSRIS